MNALLPTLNQTSTQLADLWFEGLPPNPNVTNGHHWSTHYATSQEWKQLAWVLARNAYKGKPVEHAHLHYHFSVGDKRPRDADNLIASCKHLQDGLKGVLIMDDDIDHISVEYSFDRKKPRGIRLSVSVAVLDSL